MFGAIKQPNGKYKYRSPIIRDGITYKVDEYETPKKTYGYILSMTKEDTQGVWAKSVVVGDEQDRAFDWTLITKAAIATSTK